MIDSWIDFWNIWRISLHGDSASISLVHCTLPFKCNISTRLLACFVLLEAYALLPWTNPWYVLYKIKSPGFLQSISNGSWITSCASWFLATFKTIWNEQFAQISSLIIPAGFCVHKIKCIPKLLPIRAIETRSRRKSGCSLFTSANSSTTITKSANFGKSQNWGRCFRYEVISVIGWTLLSFMFCIFFCRSMHSFWKDTSALFICFVSRFDNVPQIWGNDFNALLVPPPLKSIKAKFTSS